MSEKAITKNELINPKLCKTCKHFLRKGNELVAWCKLESDILCPDTYNYESCDQWKLKKELKEKERSNCYKENYFSKKCFDCDNKMICSG